MVNPLKKAAEAVASVLPATSTTSTTSRPTEISIPSTSSSEILKSYTNGNGQKVPQTPRTPKTPADEAIAFFSSEAGANGEEVIQIWELPLEDDGGPNAARSYIRLPPPTTPYILRISLAPGSVATRNGILKSDFPMDGGAFQRGVWKERKMPTDVTKPIKVDLPISAPGAFCYYIEHDDDYVSGKESKRVQTRKGYFNVDPIITLPARTPIFSAQGEDISKIKAGEILKDMSFGKVLGNGEEESIPLDSIAMLSIIAKWQGPLDHWGKYYEEAARRGYNFIHYTPLQSRGISGSPYSIYDQLTFDQELLKGGKDSEGDGGVGQVGEALRIAKEKYGLGSLTDVVLNHTANNSPWLEDHPESGFSPANSPHLSGAFELDTAMIELSGQLASKGLPTSVSSQSDLDRLASAVEETLHSLNLWQFYVIDVAAEKKAVGDAASSAKEWTGENVHGKSNEELVEIAKRSNVLQGYRSYAGRFPTKSDPAVAAGLIKAARPNEDIAEAWGRICDIANVDLYREASDDLKAAKENIVGRLRYTRLDAHGPRLGEISAKSPLIEPYFTRVPQKAGTNHSKETLALANNGWIWAADPLSNFAEYPGKSYVRREVIAWGDCVKLRYGNGPEDNPWLWSHIQNYCELLAEMFDGFRLDNCHSTPLHVGVRMIDAARAVNPNLYVMAELFTGSQEMDLRFVSQIGINSLVREAYNGSSPKDFSGLLYEFGVPKAIGSMAGAVLSKKEEFTSFTGKGGLRTALVTPLAGSKPHAIMYDVTHDNETPHDKRTAEDALATGALVTFTSAAIGSNKGFDDLYPKILDLVNDKRMYEVASAEQENGIGKVKRVLNNLHRELATGGYIEGHVHQENDYIVMHRVHPVTHKGYLLVAHTAFNKGAKGRGYISPFKLSHQEVTFLFGASLTTHFDQFKESDKTFKSIPNELVEITDVKVHQGQDESGPYSEVVVPDNFEPGSILLFSTSMKNIPTDLDSTIVAGALEAFADLDLVELNVVMYRSDGEERDATGDGAYDVPGLGTPPYCGLEGWMSHLRHIVEHNDLGHPLCAHLRSGCWAMGYIVDRLVRQTDEFPGLQKPAEWLKKHFDQIQAVVPSFLRPKYFSLVVYEAYKAARTAAIEQMSEFVSSGTEFTQDLALTAVQLHGQVKSASIDPSKPVPSLAAGLPHFSAGWARCWGRDVLIALRGLFLTTGNFEAARAHILAFGSTLKHGLIPNLLDSCRNPRYNCRDGPWWFCQNVQDYTKMCPNGESILQEGVKRRFPKDDTWIAWDDARAYSYSSTVAELIQEILQRHAEGIEFREHNAGPNLDNDMRDEGFNQKIYTDWSTGFIIGGNRFNCGSWMDKMGSSDKAGNKGLPATPRDGAGVEITGLLASTLIWVESLASKGAWPFKGVEAEIDGQKRLVTYKEWSQKLHDNFEKHYWVPIDSSEDKDYAINPQMVNARGIYKDVYGTTEKSREWSDYQLRCNAPLLLSVAPSLCNPEHARHHLKMAGTRLRDVIGVKTLDPADAQYRPRYINSDDSDDYAVAKGFNYHQGPPWAFPLGWELNAKLIFDKDDPRLPHHIAEQLNRSRKWLEAEPYRGIAELTQAGGEYCADSCKTQSWSSSLLNEVLYNIWTEQKKS